MRVCSATFLAAALAALVPLAALPVASAQPARPVKVNKKQMAKQYTDAGMTAQDGGDYDTALQFYGKAYELVPHPALLFNMAQAHRLAGRAAEALALYQRYLAEDPKGAQAKTARELVLALETQLAAEAQAKQAAAAEAERQAAEAERQAAEAERARAREQQRLEAERQAAEARRLAEPQPPPEQPELPPVTPVPAPPPPRSDDGRVSLRLVGIATGFAGTFVMAGGIAYGVESSRIDEDLQAGSPTPDGRTADDRDAATKKMVVLLGVGAAIAVGGGVLYWLHRDRGDRRGVAVGPAWQDGPGLVVVSGF